jgi:PAS domain S-box-containing protein
MKSEQFEEIEKRLNESILRFKETAELLPTIICEVDLNLRFLYTNQLGLELFGYTTGDLEKGIYMSDVIDESELKRMKENIAIKLSGGEFPPQVYTLKFKNNTTRAFYIHSSVMIRDKAVIGMRSCLTDITPLIEAENRLKKSEQRFRTIFSGSPIGIIVCNYDGEIVDMNSSFGAMFGLPDISACNQLPFKLFEHPPFMKENKSSIISGNAFHTESDWDFMFVKVDKRYELISAGNRYLEWHVVSLTDDSSKPIFLVQVQDVTERRKKEEALLTIERDAARKANLIAEELLRKLSQCETVSVFESRSESMHKIIKILPDISRTDVTVLITGESGTGKERIARAIHDMSPRKDKPFIAINCGALPDTLLESELFGHKAGAFTDAKKDKAGKFQLVEGGTLFLDEIGEMSQAMQVKLLRVIQERCFEPLGGNQSIPLNARIIAATNRDLPKMVAESAFREDLYYRIKVISFELPPLRQRRNDIPVLIDFFIKKFNRVFNKNILEISKPALKILLSHNYSGNIRELEHIMEHAFVFCNGSLIEPDHLPSDLVSSQQSQKNGYNPFDTIVGLEDLERQYFKHLLEKFDGDRSEIADFLHIHRTTLFRKLKQLEL